MKLLTKTTLYYVILSSIVFLVGGVITFMVFQSVINEDINQTLARMEDKVTEHIVKKDIDLKNPPKFARFVVKELEQAPQTISKAQIKDTIIKFDKWEVKFVKKIFVKEIEGKYYQISLLKSLGNTSNEMEAIFYSILGLFVSLLVVLIGFNYYISRKIWLPFEHTLREIKHFSLNDRQNLKLQNTSIQEFNELNRLIGEMTYKIKQDYNNLKEFTENASHEIQTPLAIIKAKLEILLDAQNLSEDQLRLIESAHQATNKLSRLGKALALLTRIENLEFAELQAVDFKQILDNNLEIFEELIDYKQLSINISSNDKVLVNVNPALADMLLTNLLKNAIKHNVENGKIQIELNPSKLVISNTGQKLKVLPENLFSRFQKDNPASDSLGLGLAIVKKICEVNHFTIQYEHFENIHQITVHFNQSIVQPKVEMPVAV